MDSPQRRQNLRRTRRRLRNYPSFDIVVFRICAQMGVGWTGVKAVEMKDQFLVDSYVRKGVFPIRPVVL